MSDPTTTICGTLGADPDLRYTSSGKPVANLRIVHTPRTYDKQAQEWVDGESLWLGATLWGPAAENAADCLRKGDRVMVTGRLKSRSFETRDGQRRTVIELEVEEIGASVKFATVAITKTGRTSNGSSGGGFGRQQSKPADDPWSSAPATDDGEPPF